MTGVVHVVGVGVAGLSAATALAERGRSVTVYEAAPRAGGRCRSFYDDALDAVIDNGNHLMLSGNRAINRYLDRIGARDRLLGPERAQFPFVDLASGERWTLDFGDSRWPTWLLAPSARVPGTKIADYLSGHRILTAGREATVAETLSDTGTLFDRFWKPFALAVLNTPPEAAAAGPLASVLRETILRGGRACRPLIARAGLSDALVDPAVAYLEGRGGRFVPGARLRAVEHSANRIAALRFAGTDVAVSPADAVILAVPPWVAAEMIPGLTVPDRHEPIVNAHFKVDPARIPPDRDRRLVGVLGGTAEWILARDGLISVTVSAARDLVGRPTDEIADRLWRDVAAFAGLDDAALPGFQIIKERRATFSQTPDQCARRPLPDAAGPGMILAGDWTATGLPATIEGAVRSGATAADIVLGER